MSFMEPEVYETSVYEIDTMDGTFLVPVDVVGNIGNPDDEDFNRSALQDYCEGPIDDDTPIELRQGWSYRLSAPGYMDATDTGMANTEAEAYAELLDMYGTTDDGEREEWELDAIEIVVRAATDVATVKRLCREYGCEVTFGTGGNSPLVLDVTFPEPEPTEPDTDSGDYILSPCGSLGGKIAVSQYGRCLGEFDEESEARHFIRRHMQSERYWPNVWVLSDHGNYHLTTIVE